MFTCVQRGGFQIEFSNGLTLSVMFSDMNYTSSNNVDELGDMEWYLTRLEYENRNFEQEQPVYWDNKKSKDAEIAVIHDGNLLKLLYDTVVGWVSPDTVGKICGILATTKDVDTAMEQVRDTLQEDME